MKLFLKLLVMLVLKAKILESLEESDLPIKVDLVDEKYLASSYRPGVFKDRIPLLPPRL